jgi:hypothetical protein
VSATIEAPVELFTAVTNGILTNPVPVIVTSVCVLVKITAGLNALVTAGVDSVGMVTLPPRFTLLPFIVMLLAVNAAGAIAPAVIFTLPCIVVVSPESPTVNEVPDRGLILFVFTSLILFY